MEGLESLPEPALEQPARPWTLVRQHVTVGLPMNMSEAAARLQGAPPGSNVYNALTVLLGEWSVANAWLAAADKLERVLMGQAARPVRKESMGYKEASSAGVLQPVDDTRIIERLTEHGGVRGWRDR